jgi:uncharacterized protein (TIGR02246 family)
MLAIAAVLNQAPAPADELKQIQQRLMRAWIAGDRAFIERTLAFDWTTTDASGHVLTRAQVLAEVFESPDRRIESGTIDEVQVRLLGENTAVVTGHTVAAGSYKGTRMTVNLRFMDVFIKRDGRWQAVASQATLIAP